MTSTSTDPAPKYSSGSPTGMPRPIAPSSRMAPVPAQLPDAARTGLCQTGQASGSAVTARLCRSGLELFRHRHPVAGALSHAGTAERPELGPAGQGGTLVTAESGRAVRQPLDRWRPHPAGGVWLGGLESEPRLHHPAQPSSKPQTFLLEPQRQLEIPAGEATRFTVQPRYGSNASVPATLDAPASSRWRRWSSSPWS